MRLAHDAGQRPEQRARKRYHPPSLIGPPVPGQGGAKAWTRVTRAWYISDMSSDGYYTEEVHGPHEYLDLGNFELASGFVLPQAIDAIYAEALAS